jgi:hypothetical protein
MHLGRDGHASSRDHVVRPSQPCHVFLEAGARSHVHNHASVVDTVPQISTDRCLTNAATPLATGTTAAGIRQWYALAPSVWEGGFDYCIPFCVGVPEAYVDLCDVRNRQSVHSHGWAAAVQQMKAVLCSLLQGSCKSPTRRRRCLGRAELPGKSSWTDNVSLQRIFLCSPTPRPNFFWTFLSSTRMSHEQGGSLSTSSQSPRESVEPCSLLLSGTSTFTLSTHCLSDCQ